MAKKKHRSKNRYDDEMMNMGNNNPFGIDPNALMSMMGNLDMDKVNALLESMNRDGVNLSDAMQMINNMNNMNNINNNEMGNGSNLNGNNINPLAILNGLGNMNNNLMMNNNGMENNIVSESNNREDNFKKDSYNIIKEKKEKRKVRVDDENIELLLAIRKFVSDERREFIDKVIKKYNEGLFD